jgi:hypothetical protein
MKNKKKNNKKVKKTRKYFSKPAQKNPKKKFAENSI